jgi:hypothetical protein
MRLLLGLVITLGLSACATPQRVPLSPPTNTTQPEASTKLIDEGIKNIENTLKKASTRTQRIKILVDAIDQPFIEGDKK